MVEQRTENPCVTGSIPVLATIFLPKFQFFLLKEPFFYRVFHRCPLYFRFEYQLWKNCGIFVETKNPVFLFKKQQIHTNDDTILAFLLISTPIVSASSNRIPRVMRLAVKKTYLLTSTEFIWGLKSSALKTSNR